MREVLNKNTWRCLMYFYTKSRFLLSWRCHLKLVLMRLVFFKKNRPRAFFKSLSAPYARVRRSHYYSWMTQWADWQCGKPPASPVHIFIQITARISLDTSDISMSSECSVQKQTTAPLLFAGSGGDISLRRLRCFVIEAFWNSKQRRFSF